MKGPAFFVAAAVPPVRSRLQRAFHVAGLDFHVVATLLFRGWTIVAGLATMLVLPLWLDPVRQGFYYAFTSILALQVFFELGLNQVIVQLVSHEAAHLQATADGTFAGEAAHLDALSSLARLLRRWYAVAALLFAFGAGASGLLFF
ncbi:MAG TPA: hypothetical protein VH328_00200, partial [Burkholderiaceae bacterium]|nr:hypothetical protein [Burkholderiaceae bacterium]